MWEWSHSTEAYEEWRRSLEKKRISWLQQALAEWKATTFLRPDTMECSQFDALAYEKELRQITAESKELKKAGCTLQARKQVLADEIWKKAEQLRICDNGGGAAWMCPYGCHRTGG